MEIFSRPDRDMQVGTSDSSTDSDGDGIADCVEVNDLDGNGVQNFPGDTIKIANATAGNAAKSLDFDLNGDGIVNFPGDAVLSAKIALGNTCS